MLYVYIVVSAALIPVIDRFTGFLHTPDSWWVCPLTFLGLFLGFIILQFVVTVISVLLIDLNKPPERFSRYYRTIINLILPLFFKISGVRIHSEGLDLVPEDTRFLFVCNHIDNFDPVVIMSLLPKAELGFIGKKEIYEKMKIVAKTMHKLYGLPIDRENNREAVKTIIKAIDIIKEDKASIGVFPEGYASKNGELLPLRNGAFKIAYKANVPIVVSVISGTKAITHNIFRRRTQVYFKVLEVIPTEEFKDLTTAELGDRVHGVMAKGLKDITNIA